MKEHLRTDLEKMTESEQQYLEAVSEQEAQRIIQRYKDTPNVLHGVSLKLRLAADAARARLSPNRFQARDPNPGMEG